MFSRKNAPSMKDKCQATRQQQHRTDAELRFKTLDQVEDGAEDHEYPIRAYKLSDRQSGASCGRLGRGSETGSAFSSSPSSPTSSSSGTLSSDEDHAPDERPDGRNSADCHSFLSANNPEDSSNSNNGDDDVHESANQRRDSSSSGNLVPTQPESIQLIDQVRTRFLDSLAGQGEAAEGDYDELDLAELKAKLPSHNDEHLHQSLAIRLISRYLNFDQLMAKQRLVNNSDTEDSREVQRSAADVLDKALAEATAKLRELLLFRCRLQLCHMLDDQFCKELHQLNGIFPFGHDKTGLPVLYIRARVHRRWSHNLDDTVKRFVAWQIDLLTKSNHGAKVAKAIAGNNFKDGSFGICFDCLHVSYSCVDLEFLRYLVKILVEYYPTYCRYALCVDLPWLFRSVWKLVRSWLPEEAQGLVHLITAKELVEFIAEDQIPNSIQFNDLPGSEKPTSGKHKLPVGFNSFKGIDDFAQDLNLSSSETKQFKSHAEKVVKEYRQLGAI